MSTIIRQELAASGVAPVICVLEDGATGSKATAADVEKAIFASALLEGGMVPERAHRGLPNGPRALTALLDS